MPESGSPVSPDLFRHLVGGFAAGVTIVTTRAGDGTPWGFTASSFCSVSLVPPLVLVCLDVTADCHPAFVIAGAMTVNVLAATQHDLALLFATRGVDKFAALPALDGLHTSSPRIDGALAHIECRMHARHDGGDHTILVGEVLGGRREDGEPLLYYSRSFGQFKAE